MLKIGVDVSFFFFFFLELFFNFFFSFLFYTAGQIEVSFSFFIKFNEEVTSQVMSRGLGADYFRVEMC